MSLQENGTNAHTLGVAGLAQPNSLRKPMAKSPELESFMNNGPKDPPVTPSGSAWPISKNNSVIPPGDPVWGINSLGPTRTFDFSSIITTPTTPNLDEGADKIWQSLNSNAIAPTNTVSKETPGTPGGNSWSTVVGSATTSKLFESPKPNGVIQAPPGFTTKGNESIFCESCEDKHSAIAHCHECKEDLCERCTQAHRRVKFTKGHTIAPLSFGGRPDNSGSTQQQPPFKVGANSTQLMLNRGLVQSDVLQVYKGAVEKAKTEGKNLIGESKKIISLMDETKVNIENTNTRIDVRYNNVKSEIVTMTQNYMAAIKEREKTLLLRLEKIRQLKLATLMKQKAELNKCQTQLRQSMDTLSTLSSVAGNDIPLIKATEAAVETLRESQKIFGSGMVNEDDSIEFIPPDPSMLKALSGLSYIGGSGFAPFCIADGDGLKKAILGKDAGFHVVVKDQLQEQRQNGGENLRINVVAPDGRFVRHSMHDRQNGTYRVVWKPSNEGEHRLSITLKDMHIDGSPFIVPVRQGRNYAAIRGSIPLSVFGTEGEADGQLCRPWGVCCSREGLILVANRSNNRIEVFDKTGQFLYNFGKPGKGNGEFERPASVTCDRMNRVIVTDKDNHRIQIFTIKGDFLQMFGEKGSKPGQFNYPWDVAINSRDCILVSDTRNHRIQLFSPNGEFMAKYGFEGREWKHFDSPRGVCFCPDDQIVVTDFNNHRLLVVSKDMTCAQYLGKEGTEDGFFTRPNGVAVDEEGNIIVADSRNDRIQVFSSSGVFITKFGLKGTAPGEFDRPSGICISPEGVLIVVDFGNNRVQMF